MSGTVIVSDPEDGIRLLTISRPTRRNALDSATYTDLSNALHCASTNHAARVLVLTGAGGCFTSGNDLAGFQTGANTADAATAIDFLKTLAAYPKPVIAAVEGFAIGIGTTLLLHCDLAYAGRSTQFRLPFISLGLCPEGASSYLLPRVAGAKRAAELLMLGEPFTAQTAADAGIINAVTVDGEALATALSKARMLAKLSPDAVAVTKSLLKRNIAETVATTFDVEAKSFSALLASPEAQAAFKAFFAK